MRAGAEVHSLVPERGRRALPVSCVATFAGVRPGGVLPLARGAAAGGQIRASSSLRAPPPAPGPRTKPGPPLRELSPLRLPKPQHKDRDLGREVERGELVS